MRQIKKKVTKKNENVHIDANKIQAAVPLCNVENTSMRELKVVLTRCTVQHYGNDDSETSSPIPIAYSSRIVDNTESNTTIVISVSSKANSEIESTVRRSSRAKKTIDKGSFSE